MTLDDFLTYVKSFDNMEFITMKEYDITYNKLLALIDKFNFKVIRSFPNSFKFKLQVSKYDYVYITIGKKGSTLAKGYILGHVAIEDEKTPLNPQTGRPWEEGDIDYSSPSMPMWTRRGWRTGC